MEVVDALGRAVRVAGPQRIVSLVPSETLAVVDLGARPQLVGRTDYCILPSDIHEVTSVGGTKGIDVG
ncbi:MAG: helical backbone metal receptor, partial [Myxococcota bacterium]